MMGPTHVAIGTTTALGVVAVASPELMHGVILVAAAVGSSKMPDQLEVFGLRHRGPTHWLLTATLVCLVVGVVAGMVVQTEPYAWWILAGVAVGYGMHIAADCCTVSGVPVLGPFRKRPVWLLPRGWRFVTGKSGDSLLAILMGAASLGLGYLIMVP